MTLKTSLIITGDGSVAQAAVDALRAGVDELAASTGKAAGPANALDSAQKAVASSAGDAAGATEALAAELKVAQAAALAQAAMVADLTAANAELSAELAGTRAASAGLEAQLQQTGAASTAMAAGADDLAGRIVALEGANGALAAELREVQAASSVTTSQLDQLSSANAQLGAELAQARTASAGMQQQLQQAGAATAVLSTETSDLTARVTTLEAANAALAGELAQVRAAASGLEGELQQAQAASAALAGKVDILETRLQNARKAHVDAGSAATEHGRAMGTASIASAELEHVIRAGSDAYAAGIPLTRIFSSEIGRVAQAAQYMGGALGPIGTFLGGPWGAAFTIGVTVLAPFIAKLLDANSALEEQKKDLEEAAKAADSFGNAQSLIGKAIDLATGKLKTHNLVLLETIKLQAQAGLLAAREDQKKASKALTDQTTPGVGETLGDVAGVFGALVNPAVGGNAGVQLLDAVGKRVQQLGPLAHALNDYKTAASSYAAVLNDPGTSTAALNAAATKFNASLETALVNIGNGATRSGRDAIDTKKKILALGTALNDQLANRQAIDVLNGGPIPDDLKPYKKDPKPKKPKKPKKAPDTSGLVNTVKGDIAHLTAEFTDAPTFVEKAREAVGKLDHDIAELQKKKPPNFRSLIDQATAAKGVIEANIAKPYNDYIKAQAENLDVMKLQAAGLDDQAAALKEIQALSKTEGNLITGQYDATKYTADEYQRLVAAAAQQRAGVLATVEALRAEQRQIDINREHVALFETALGDIKSVVEDATLAFTRGDLGQLVKSPGKLLDAFTQLNGKLVFEKLFGEAFRQLDDQIHGRNVVKSASEDMAAAVGTVTDQTKKTVSAFSDLAAAAKKTADALTPAAPAGGALTGVVATGADAVNNNSVDAGGQGSPVDANGDIVVTGRRSAGIDLSALFATAHTNLPDFSKMAAKLDHLNPTDLFGSAIGKLATSGLRLAGVDEHIAQQVGEGVGKFSGKAFAGAATGQMVSGIGNAIGIHLNQTGSQIGGALAGGLSTISSSLGFLGGPLGMIGGSLVGGLLGSLFAPKAHPGGATVASVNGSAAVSGTVGSDKEGIATGKSLGGNVASGLNNIVQQLGGTLGDFNVEIGTYKKDLRVNTNGRPLGGVSGSGAVSFGDDQAAAVSYAVAQAVAQGAVKGIDDKVAAALRSSTNIDDALKEALKVDNLETWIGGVQGTFDKAFKDFGAQAKDRVRVATQYGFDVVAIEKKNADDRLTLAAQLAKQQVGSLQTLLDSLNQGDLFEGSAADKIKAINTAIDKAKADLANGVDGAGDTLANLYQERLTTSKDAYGTAGSEYTSARDDTRNDAQAAIAKINAQIAASEAKSDPALATTNASLDEANDLAAVANTKLDQLLVAVTAPGGAARSVSTLATARYTELV